MELYGQENLEVTQTAADCVKITLRCNTASKFHLRHCNQGFNIKQTQLSPDVVVESLLSLLCFVNAHFICVFLSVCVRAGVPHPVLASGVHGGQPRQQQMLRQGHLQ